MITMWVWNLWKKDIPRFIEFCKEKKVNKILLNHECYDNVISLIKNNGFEIIPLIGDSKNELNYTDVMNICKNYEKVHLDIEWNTKLMSYKQHCTLLDMIISELKNRNVLVETDVHTWLPFRKYKKVLRKADELHLMSYSKSFFGTLLQVFPFMFIKPFSIGFETNPNLNCRTEDVNKRMRQFSFMKRFKNFIGFSIHCWGFWE